MKSIKWIALFLALLVFLSGCAGTHQSGGSYNIYLIAKSSTTEFWKSVFAGANAAKSEYNVQLTILAPDTEEDFEVQNDYIRQAVADGADAIVFSAISYTENAAAIDEAVAAGVRVVVIDSDVDSKGVSVRIGTDNIAAGRMSGEAALKTAQEKIVVGIVNAYAETQNCREREQGFREVLLGDCRVKGIYAVNVSTDALEARLAAEKLLRELYKVFSRSNKPVVVTTPETAEMIKYASNAFLATKITFINEIANLCEQVGANALEVAAAMGKDGRISPKFLHPGPGYGGSCFPKDTKALADTGKKFGAPMTVVESVVLANQRQKKLAAEKIMRRFPDGGVIALLGLSFKPETDDIRESPAVEIAGALLADGRYTVRMYDPKALENARRQLGGQANAVWCGSKKEALDNADAVVIATEWSEFASMDLAALGSSLRQPVLFDLRNVYRKSEAETAGLEYYGTGV